jgi:GH15 family glucan-1,4-alpha-glucosidase
LEEHRLLGGDGMAALVAPDGAVEWWCTPRLDSPAVLWRMLDDDGGAAVWRDAKPVRSVGGPAGPCARTIVEVDGQPVSCWDGLVRIDGEPTLVRLVRAVRAPVEVVHELNAAVFDPNVTTGEHLLRVHGDAEHRATAGGVLRSTLVATTERWSALVLRRSTAPPPPTDVASLRARMRDAEDEAATRRDASDVISSHRERVEVTLQVLDTCTEPTTGAVIAAPTTSVPEVLGADRNFDYRFAWVRDASLAASVAALLGRPEATRGHVDWLLDRCLGCDGVPTPVTDVFGEPVPPERELAHVAGLAGSKPVRVGNAARDQVQIDGAGFVAEAVWTLAVTAGSLRRDAYRAVADLADHVADLPVAPTAGIWELREPALVTDADVGRWLLFDRALRLCRVHQPWAHGRRRRWQRARGEAEARLVSSLLPSGALPVVHGRTEVDGAGLLLVVLRLLDPDDPRAARLVDATIEALAIGDPVVALRRYSAGFDVGFEGLESAFVPVSWWAVSALARLDRADEAHALADRLCEATPGLQPEMLDPGGDGALGNVPLVWSHAEAARALYLLRLADLRARWGGPGAAAWQGARVVRQALHSAHVRRTGG